MLNTTTLHAMEGKREGGGRKGGRKEWRDGYFDDRMML